MKFIHISFEGWVLVQNMWIQFLCYELSNIPGTLLRLKAIPKSIHTSIKLDEKCKNPFENVQMLI